jgi:hypothetical protein
LGLPSILHEHANHGDTPWFQKVADRLLAPHTDLAIAVSESTAEFTIRARLMPAERTKVVYLGSPLDEFARDRTADEIARARHSLGIEPSTIAVGTVTRLMPSKGNEYLLEAVPAMEGFFIRLRHGLADLPAFERGVRRIVSQGDGQVHLGSEIQNAAEKAQRPIHLEAIALALFGAITGLAALLVLGQALARQVAADTDDHSTLAALGADRPQLVAVPLARAIIIGLAGAVVAVVVALLLSPLTPIGLARRAEIHPGFCVNWAVLAVGFLCVAGVVVLRAFVAAWRAARSWQEHGGKKVPARPGPLNATASGSRLGPPAVAGLAMAFERGRGVASGTTILGNLAAIAGVVAAITFGASLNHLVDAREGWNWDVFVGNPNTQALRHSADPRTSTWSVSGHQQVRVPSLGLPSRTDHCRWSSGGSWASRPTEVRSSPLARTAVRARDRARPRCPRADPQRRWADRHRSRRQSPDEHADRRGLAAAHRRRHVAATLAGRLRHSGRPPPAWTATPGRAVRGSLPTRCPPERRLRVNARRLRP